MSIKFLLAPPRRLQLPPRGHVTVEFAFVVILLLGMLTTIFEGARLITSYIVLGNAARDGARAGLYAVSSTSTNCGAAPKFVPPMSVTCIDKAIKYEVNQKTLPRWMTVPDSSITICRRAKSSAVACLAPNAQVASDSLTDVTVTYTFQLLPFAGGWLGKNGGVPLTGYHRARAD